MTEEEFLKLINDYVGGHLCHSENWKYHCFSMVIDKCRDSGRTEIRIQYSPYKVENSEEKEVKKTLVRNCDVGTTAEQMERFQTYCSTHEPCESCPLGRLRATPSCGVDWAQMPYKPTGE